MQGKIYRLLYIADELYKKKFAFLSKVEWFERVLLFIYYYLCTSQVVVIHLKLWSYFFCV